MGLLEKIESLDLPSLDSFATKSAFMGVLSTSIFGGIAFGMRAAQKQDTKAYQEALIFILKKLELPSTFLLLS